MNIQTNSPEDVFNNTVEIPYCPFEAKINSTGISILLKTIDDNYSTEESDPSQTDIDPSAIVNKDEACESISEVIGLYRYGSSNLTSGEVFIRYEDKLVQPEFHIVYTVFPENSQKEFTLIGDNAFDKIPDKEKQYSGHGTISNKDDTLEFNKETSFIDNIQGNSITIPLRNSNVDTIFEKHELVDNETYTQPLQHESGSCTFGLEENKFKITVTANQSTYTFIIPLTKFGTLPEWADERIDIPSITRTESEEYMATLKQTTNETRFVSEDNSRVLLSIE